MIGEHRPDVPSVVEGFTGWRVKMGTSFNYSDGIRFVDTVMIGDLDAPEGLGAFAHHGTSDVAFERARVEGFALGLQVPRAGNQAIDSGSWKAASIVDCYLDNALNLHLVHTRNHDFLHVDVVRPRFGSLGGEALAHGLTALAAIDDDADLDIDSSNLRSNGFPELADAVADGRLDGRTDWYLHHLENVGTTVDTRHRRDSFLPWRITVTDEGGRAHRLFFEREQSASFVPFPSVASVGKELGHEDGRDWDSTAPLDPDAPDGNRNSNLPAEFVGAKAIDIAERFQRDAANPAWADFATAKDRDGSARSVDAAVDYPGFALAPLGRLLPGDWTSDPRFESWPDTVNLVAMRIDDLPDRIDHVGAPDASGRDAGRARHARARNRRLPGRGRATRPGLPRRAPPAGARAGAARRRRRQRSGAAARRRERRVRARRAVRADPRELHGRRQRAPPGRRRHRARRGRRRVRLPRRARERTARRDGARRRRRAPAGLRHRSRSAPGTTSRSSSTKGSAARCCSSTARARTPPGSRRCGPRAARRCGWAQPSNPRLGGGARLRGAVDDLVVEPRTYTDAALAAHAATAAKPDSDRRARDADADGTPDVDDVRPLDADLAADRDGDRLPDALDAAPSAPAADADGDGVPDPLDRFVDDFAEWGDADGDGIGDRADDDRDGDGVANASDALPDDEAESADRDGDGIGDLPTASRAIRPSGSIRTATAWETPGTRCRTTRATSPTRTRTATAIRSTRSSTTRASAPGPT